MTSNVKPNSLVGQTLAQLNKRPKVNASPEDQATSTVAKQTLTTIPEEPKRSKKRRARNVEKTVTQPKVGKGSEITPIEKLMDDGEKTETVASPPETRKKTVPEPRMAYREPKAVTRLASSTMVAELDTYNNGKSVKIRLLVIGFLLAGIAAAGIGLLTNFKFNEIKLTDWRWDALGGVGVIGVALLIVSILKRNKLTRFQMPKSGVEERPSESVQAAVIPANPNAKQRGDNGKVRNEVTSNSTFSYQRIRQGVNSGKTT